MSHTHVRPEVQLTAHARADAAQAANARAAQASVRANVETVARLEHEALRARSVAQRVSDACVRAVGSMPFLLLHVTLLVAWLAVNLGYGGPVPAFDPFPFGILALLVSSEGVFLAIFILITQNRMTRQADRLAHLHLQIGLLAEEEVTGMLRLQRRLCEHLGMAPEPDDAAVQLTAKTSVQGLAGAIDETLPER